MLDELKTKTENQRREWLDRFMDQEYLDSNNTMVKASCGLYDVSNPLCRSCRYYSQRVQLEKTGMACPHWKNVFGNELRLYMEKLALDGVKVGKKFLDIWNARKLLTAPTLPQRLVITSSQNSQQASTKNNPPSVISVVKVHSNQK